VRASVPPALSSYIGPVTLLLVVEDDEEIGALLSRGLHAAGHQVHWRRDGRSALADVRVDRPDLVVLDLGLPDMDGVDLCREIRAAAPGTVIVMLTARNEEMDVVSGLESGADDYLTKPFRHAELLARIQAHLRRSGTGADDGAHGGPLRLTIGGLEIDAGSRTARVRDQDVELRAKEFDLLWRLCRDVGSALSRETLMSDVWDENWFGSTKTLDVHIAALRRKLAGAAPPAPEGPGAPTITTLRGHGYRLERPGR